MDDDVTNHVHWNIWKKNVQTFVFIRVNMIDIINTVDGRNTKQPPGMYKTM